MWNTLKKTAAKANEALVKQQEAKRDPGIYEDWKPAKPKTSPVAAVAAKPMPPAPAPAKPAPVVTGAKAAAKPLFKESAGNVDVSRLQNDLAYGRITQEQYNQRLAELKKKYASA